ncbi:small oligopeptide transporter [Mycena sanguinolenta]|nr:small oligopeptide transporter [Mycena sanguinolenta]
MVREQVYAAFDPNRVEPTGEIAEEDSPYPEVRSAVANFDDPEMPASTIRSWTLGILFSIVIPGINQFFHFRYPSQLIAFPIGTIWARWMPNISLFGIALNPGPFTTQNLTSVQVLIIVMAAVGSGSAYATDVVAVQKIFYGQSYSFACAFLVISSQCIGFSIGGIARRFLVAPPSMIWPNTLVTCALCNTLHSQNYAGIGKHPGMSRERFFLLAFLATATWYFIPGYLFQALSYFSWVCRITTTTFIDVDFNVHILSFPLSRYNSGLGFSVITLDWNQIAYIGVWWAEANVLISFTLFYCAFKAYYSNVWYAQYLPISSVSAFDNTGKYYDHTRIIKDGKLDLDAYEAYSPLYLPMTFAMSYGLSFMCITATIVHAIVYFWAPIKLHFKRSLREQPDIHAKLMMAYPEVPDWYYACIFVVTFIIACVCIECWDTGMTIWALILSLCVALLYVIPVGMIQAITNCKHERIFTHQGLVITELLVGFIIPGRPLAMMMCTYGYITMSRAMQFTADFKLGHYMKIPPRPMFWCQVRCHAKQFLSADPRCIGRGDSDSRGEPLGVLPCLYAHLAQTVQLGVQSWMFAHIPDLCSPGQPAHWNCAPTRVFGTASVIWGLIGPHRFFSNGKVYFALVFFFVIGAACPILLWLVTRRRRNTILNYIRLIFSALGQIPPATAINYVPWAVFGFIFQYLVRRKYFAYWTKYNYVLSAALDAGTAFGLMLVFFCLQYPLNGTIGSNSVLKWWGNAVHMKTLDWQNAPLRTLLKGETFGPKP